MEKELEKLIIKVYLKYGSGKIKLPKEILDKKYTLIPYPSWSTTYITRIRDYINIIELPEEDLDLPGISINGCDICMWKEFRGLDGDILNVNNFLKILLKDDNEKRV